MVVSQVAVTPLVSGTPKTSVNCRTKVASVAAPLPWEPYNLSCLNGVRHLKTPVNGRVSAEICLVFCVFLRDLLRCNLWTIKCTHHKIYS